MSQDSCAAVLNRSNVGMGQRDHIFIKSCELGTQPSKCHKKAVYSSKRNNLGSEQLIALLNYSDPTKNKASAGMRLMGTTPKIVHSFEACNALGLQCIGDTLMVRI